MKEFTLYVFRSDDEGGYGVCKTAEWSPKIGYNPESGWRAKPSEKVGEFDSVEELANILMSNEKEMNDLYLAKKNVNTNPRVIYGNVIYHNFEYHLRDAVDMMDDVI